MHRKNGYNLPLREGNWRYERLLRSALRAASEWSPVCQLSGGCCVPLFTVLEFNLSGGSGGAEPMRNTRDVHNGEELQGPVGGRERYL